MSIDAAARPRFLGLGLSSEPVEVIVNEVVRLSRGQRFSYVVTPNVDHVVKLSREGEDGPFRQSYPAAALRLCDSRVLARLARFCGERLTVIVGCDLTEALFRSRFGVGDRVAIIGGDADTLPALNAQFPGPHYLQHIPPMGIASDKVAQTAIVDFVTEARPNYTFFAVGAPRSEVLAARLAHEGRATGVGLCIGASIEFLTGVKPRAPRWMQQRGLEWLFRLLTEPGRLWRRYLVEGPAIFAIVLRWRLTGRAI
jgi:N-acetylglucosaminyldiphosphoundecaprenol N-acetyl-beta-D-mannosaminyltransferase